MSKVILAFTGGLQSSVCLHWLVEHEGRKVKVLVGDLGQPARGSGIVFHSHDRHDRVGPERCGILF